MGGFVKTNNKGDTHQHAATPASAAYRAGGRPKFCCGCCRVKTLDTVATSRVVSARSLLVFRVGVLLVLVVAGTWLTWRTGDRPLCLPDWSFVSAILYFVVAVAACLRYAHLARWNPAPESANRSLASSFALLVLEISVVFQTIAVIITWLEYARDDEGQGRAVVSSIGLGVLVADLVVNRCTVEAKHAWILLAFLLAWVVEQVAWVSADSQHEACYEVFDAEGLDNAISAVVASLIVVALAFAYAALCVQRDRLLSRFGFGPGPDPARQDDVEEDLGDEAAVTRVMTLPPMTQPVPAPLTSERSYVVNPVFAGKGSRMKRNPLAHGVKRSGSSGGGGERRTSLASMETDMSSGEDHEAGWPLDGDVRNSGAGSKHSRGSSADAGMSNHLSSWAGYGGGGAAAWVRSGREAPPPLVVWSGGKESQRRTNSK
ncbi:unnamed protein product [Ectocarpus sp. 12 AP-2014]